MGKPYQLYTTGSPSPIKRFSHHKRFEVVLTICKKIKAFSLLDIGTGDAYFLKLAHQNALNIPLLHALEPSAEYHEEAEDMISHIQNAQLHKSWSSVNQTYDIVTCQEVLEHLPDDKITFILEKIRKHLTPSGYLIVTVPLEIGLAGFIKNITRLAIGARHRNTSFSTIIKSSFGIPINRIVNANGYISSHIGFNHSLLEKKFTKAKYEIMQTQYSPFPYAGTIVNSQKIYLLKPIK